MTTEDRRVRDGYLDQLNEALELVLPWIRSLSDLPQEVREWTVELMEAGPATTRWQVTVVQNYGEDLAEVFAEQGDEKREAVAFIVVRLAEMYTSRFRLTPANLDEDRRLMVELKEQLLTP